MLYNSFPFIPKQLWFLGHYIYFLENLYHTTNALIWGGSIQINANKVVKIQLSANISILFLNYKMPFFNKFLRTDYPILQITD